MKCKNCTHEAHPNGPCRAVGHIGGGDYNRPCGCLNSEPLTFDVPLCPNCNDPIRYSFSIAPVAENVAVMMGMLWCAECGHLFSAQMLGALQPPKPMIETAGPSGPLKL